MKGLLTAKTDEICIHAGCTHELCPGRNFALTMDMAEATDPVVKAAKRANAAGNFFPTEYKAMLYGSSAVPTLTSPHYTLCPEGATTTGTAGAALLYSTHECLRVNQSTCLAKNHTLYQVLHSIIARNVRSFCYVSPCAFSIESRSTLRTRPLSLSLLPAVCV